MHPRPGLAGPSSAGCVRNSSSYSPLRPPRASFSRRKHIGNAVAAASASSSSDVVVVGGGAAGLTAAYFAARQGAQVTILERMPEAGRKILISGGTRCNVLPEAADAERDFFTESSSRALRGMLASWPVADAKAWLERDVGLQLALEPETRKWFPSSNSSREVRDRLLAAATSAGAAVRYDAGLAALEQRRDSGWLCRTQDGGAHSAQRVVMATGGKSYPKLGTDGRGWDLLAALGHSLKSPYPALTPLKGSHPGGTQLAGLTMHGVQLSARQRRARAKPAVAQRGSLLFSHRGVTGPAVLDLSHHAIMALERGAPLPALTVRGKEAAWPAALGGERPGSGGAYAPKTALTVRWTGADEAAWSAALAEAGGVAVASLLHRRGVPTRLADALCAAAGIDGRAVRAAELKKAQRSALLQALTACEIDISGHEGYMKAEVTGGGIPLSEINCATCESRKLPGMHICGELLDVFGRIGGFNFYWAFVSARLAGLAAGAPS